jgi:hypothetical protein
MVFAATTQQDIANSAYLWVGVVVGLLMLLGGGGGVYALVKWLKRQGVRDGRLDEMIDPEEGWRPQLAAIKSQLGEQDVVLAAAKRSMQSNGLDTMQVGDIARRTELAVRELQSSFDVYRGANETEHKSLWVAVNRKADKLP